MPKVKHPIQRERNATRSTHLNRIDAAEVGRPCVAGDHCPNTVVPNCPVGLCGAHLREIYEFAADLVTDRWDESVRSYVAGLHDTFKPPRSVRQPLAGWLYFIRFGDRVKVGYTTKPDERLRGLPHEQVIGVIPGARRDEASWHRLLADFHVVGEWFRAEPEVLTALERVASQSA